MIDLPPLELALRVSLTREGGLAYLPGLARTRSIDLTSCPSDLRQEVG
ncbi:protealysin inhibitor emfourin, partial [Achromobacter ruhlandii]